MSLSWVSAETWRENGHRVCLAGCFDNSRDLIDMPKKALFGDILVLIFLKSFNCDHRFVCVFYADVRV